ncbi:MAG: O-antigen ligase family protein [Roseiflexaceae bacterium]
MRSQTSATGVGWVLTLVLESLPFELYTGVPLAGLTFTNVEILVLAMLALWAVRLVIERRLPRLPRGFLLPTLALLAIFCVSAAFAPEWRGAALKFTARQLQAALLGLCLADQIAVGGWPIAQRLGLALIMGAAISAALGLLEISESPLILLLLANFKDQPTMAGGLLRLSATFGYANIAAMFYEATLPICLVAVGLATNRRARLMLSGAALLLFTATLLTYSRAALLTTVAAILMIMLGAILLERRALGNAISGVDRPKDEGRTPAFRAFVLRPSSFVRGWLDQISAALVAQSARRVVRLSMLLLALTAAALLFSPTFRVRIAAPDVADWYRADYSVAALPSLAPNALLTTPVTLHNRGLVTWRSAGLRPVALSYHWLDPRTRRVVRYNGRRTLLPQPIDPGGALQINANVQAPEKPGDYLLAWDMVVEHSGWFSERGNPIAEIAVTVAGQPVASQPAASAEPATMPQQLVVRPAPPARGLLWGAALQIWRAHPLLGIGPDTFRHMYGPQLGLRIWDDRVHTNSLYLELLVGTGVAGLAAFLLLIALALGQAARVLVRMDDRSTLLRAGGRRTTDDGRQRNSLLSNINRQSSAESALGFNRDAQVWMALGCAAALLTFLLHGVLDMFLEYTATNLLLWGLIGALGGLAMIGGHSARSAFPGRKTKDEGRRTEVA